MPPSPSPGRPSRAFDWSTAIIAVLVVAAAARVFWRDGSGHFFAIVASDFDLLLGVLPKVLAGCLIGVFVTLLLPREKVARWVGAESGFGGILIATVMGAILPGGPFTIFPVAGAFLMVGADAGAVVAFITSWSLLGYARALVWELPFFGIEFVGWRILAALPLPFLAAWLARLVVRKFGFRLT